MWPPVSFVNYETGSIIAAIRVNAGGEHVQIVDHVLVT